LKSPKAEEVKNTIEEEHKERKINDNAE
jgi:hypothetical protein